MGLNAILKDEVRDILSALRSATVDSAIAAPQSSDAAAYLAGYLAALEAVALALGLRSAAMHTTFQAPTTPPGPRRLPSQNEATDRGFQVEPRVRRYP
jgi:hypothetical protein